jgi:hypothetical protein
VVSTGARTPALFGFQSPGNYATFNSNYTPDGALDNVFNPDDAEVLPPVRGHVVQRLSPLFLSFSATFLGLMQAAYGGALAYLTGRMSGAPIPHYRGHDQGS